MNIILDLLDAANPPAVQSQALLVLVSALLATPQNTRTFEDMDGLLTVASLFKSRGTTRELKLKLLEFFYFYLMPETAPGSQNAAAKSTEDKQRQLGKYLNNVSDLVQDLRENAPFAIAV